MNKIIITICALCLSLMSSAQVKYTIKGTVHGMNDEMIYLYTMEGERFKIDSTTVKNNSFIFKGTQPQSCFASINGSIARANLYLENGTINVVIDIYTTITGTPINNILTACINKISMFDDEFGTLSKQKHKLKKDDEDALAEWEKKRAKLMNKRKEVIKECITQNLDNVIGTYLLNQSQSILSVKEVSEIVADISPAMKEHYYTKRAVEHHEALMRTEIGQKFTDFKIKDLNDKEVSLSDYVGKGKYVLIDFWASWCNPCRMEIPYLKAAYEKFKSKGFEIVGVSLDSKKEDWLKYIKNSGITWPQMSDLKIWQCEGATLYGVRGIPSTFLIDPDGIIIAKGLRGEAIEKKLSELLK